MPNRYTCVDPDYIYTDPQTGVLRNIGNIGDNEALQFAEAGAIARRSQELSDKTDYDQWLARKVAKSIKAADDGKLLSSSDVDAQSEALIALFAPGVTK